MSCVLANRIILNVRAANQALDNIPSAPYQVTIEENGTRTNISDVEMAQLRSLRSQRERKFSVL